MSTGGRGASRGLASRGAESTEMRETSMWDRGTYSAEKWREDEIVIQINGVKLSGRYCLIRFRKEENTWLFFRC